MHLYFSGGEVLRIEGERFGAVWYTNAPSYVGNSVAGKRHHTDNLVELILPALSHGQHAVELYIENLGVAVMA